MWEGIAAFIFNILAELSGQLRAPVDLALERRLSGSTEAVWTFSRRDKYLASARSRRTMPCISSRGWSLY